MKKIVFIFILLSAFNSFSQIDPSISLTFDFNEHEIKEKDNKVFPKSEGVTLTADRFGNEQSAIYIHGHLYSYLNLGISPLLKPIHGTVSLWVNLDRRVYSGKGYQSNPIITTKNGPGEDFISAYSIIYDGYSKRLMSVLTKDSLEGAIVASIDNFTFGKWHHMAITFDRSYMAFYVDGELQQRAKKNFETTYLATDSVNVGHSGDKKNERFAQGIFDDIQFFHRVLSAAEIKELYQAPNPNRASIILNEVLKYGGIVLFFLIVIVVIILRNRKNAAKQKEQLELKSKISELELKVVKSQMNPHFISNCLAAIQELIYTENFKKAAQYLAKFSFFLRQVLNYSDRTFISLEEELNIIKLNIELEQLRFKDDFEFNLIVNEEVDINNFLIPSMITQPFIENAIWHGLLPLKGIRKACLTVNVVEKNKIVFIEIEDNGIGRRPSANSKNSRGTKLVMDKIENINKLTNGNDYKLEIVDLFDLEGKPSGTKIVLQLKDITE